MSDSCRVGIIGGGTIAEFDHIPGYTQHNSAEIVSLAEIDDKRRKSIAAEYNIKQTYSDGLEMIKEEDLDAISICTPPNTHETLFLAAASRGFDIYCEKPLTTSPESAVRMQEATNENDIYVDVGYILGHKANFQKSHHLVNEGIVGEIKTVSTTQVSPPPEPSWYFNSEKSGGGVVMDKLPHLLDFYIELFDCSPRIVNVILRSSDNYRVEDVADLQLAFETTTVNVALGWTGKSYTHHTSIMGSKGHLFLQQDWLTGKVQGKSVCYRYGSPPRIDLGSVGRLGLKPKPNATKQRITEFVNRVNSRTKKPADPLQRSVEILDTIETIYDIGEIA